MDQETNDQSSNSQQEQNNRNKLPLSPKENILFKSIIKFLPIFFIFLGLIVTYFLYTSRQKASALPLTIPSPAITEDNTTPQEFQNKECLVFLNYPQRTTAEGINYLWFLEIKNDSVLINYQDRDPNIGPDTAVTLYSKKQIDPEAKQQTFIIVACTKNSNNLDLDGFYEKYQKAVASGLQIEKIGIKKIGGVDFVEAIIPNTEYKFYLGVYKDQLYYIANTLKSQGRLQEETGKILENIKFL